MIRQEIAKSSQLGRFNIQNVQQHEHGGVGSRTTLQPTRIYGGAIDTDGAGLILPTGWTSSIELVPNIVYTVNHNLDTSTYIVSVLQIIPDSGFIGSPTIAPGINKFELTFLNVADGAENIQTPFYFILININNKSQVSQNYDGPWLSTTQFNV